MSFKIPLTHCCYHICTFVRFFVVDFFFHPLNAINMVSRCNAQGRSQMQCIWPGQRRCIIDVRWTTNQTIRRIFVHGMLREPEMRSSNKQNSIAKQHTQNSSFRFSLVCWCCCCFILLLPWQILLRNTLNWTAWQSMYKTNNFCKWNHDENKIGRFSSFPPTVNENENENEKTIKKRGEYHSRFCRINKKPRGIRLFFCCSV